ncbi:thiamine pyrophosphate domain-containing TPP-binding protein [Thermincola ferriacetica]|uniref:Thiamine pyrophosphate domain-containing TPP-binding protein n=1 Tax=Thermincola ferriacetica TaxID=281456 RepID=A0A0L6W598_9FIRM|nr:thiamine pyrophosphate-dependent enzyme [Thermincola ferriacetica]KNZ70757.1 thiamine pyrophosphate domain-containing TPP-binding protein [Thermincola ferriacetica]
MKKVFTRPKALTDKQMHYCPGCTHGVVHRLAAEVIDELGIQEKTIGIAPVGCAVFAYEYWDIDCQQASHGRAPAVATGIKRVHPDSVVFTYQGDGDLAAIGTAEIVHAAARGEKITVLFINNTIYGMTGGQLAPTTLIGQKSTTTPYGRDKDVNGYPVRMTEMLSVLDGVAYAVRVSVHNPANILKAKKAIKKAFEVQMNNEGFAIVEILSTCPTNWGLPPVEAVKWLEENMLPYYPLGEYKVSGEVAK